MKRNVTDFALYRFRYVIGYLILLIAISSLLVFAGLFVPGGLRAEEINAIASSGALSFTDFDPNTVINLPYHLLQRLSLSVLGVSVFSIKLPSIILGVMSIMGVYLLIREWFRTNSAIITTLLAATIPIFLFMAQDGTPAIYATAISIWLLYAATLVSRRRTPTILWKIILFIMIALNLYTPLGIYVTIAVATTVIFHPHVRHTIKHFSSAKLAGAGAIFIILLVPLLYSLAVKPTIGLTLLGIPKPMPDLIENLLTVLRSLFDFMGGSLNGMLYPILSIGLAIVILIGIYRFILNKYMARSYIIWFWSIILIPFIILTPSYVTYLYPLIVLMIAMGISSIISTWYKMFPNNPYARVVGLLPISVIVIGISMSGVNRYALSYTYSPELRRNFSQDVRLFSELRATLDQNTVPVIVSKQEQTLYQVYAQFDDSITVTEVDSQDISTPTIVTSAARKDGTITGTIDRIVTDSRKDTADRLYLYTPLDK